MKTEELLDAINHLDAHTRMLVKKQIDDLEVSNVFSKDEIDVEAWMKLFYEATQSFQELSDIEWSEIEESMNVEYIKIPTDEE